MGGLPMNNPWAFTFAIDHRRTFYGIYLAGRINEVLSPLPYIISIFTCMLSIYYALILRYAVLLTINIIGFIFSTIYITIYLYYSPKKTKIYTTILIMLLDVGLFALILVMTLMLWKGEDVLGGIYLVCLTISSFVSHLSTIYKVIKTRIIKCMPFHDSLLTILGGSAWLASGLLMKNKSINAVPDALSLIFGVIQMMIYMKYNKDHVDSPHQSPEVLAVAGEEVDIEMV